MTEALKDTIYVKNSVSMLDDFELNECSIPAQLIFHRGMLLAKRAATDGVVSWRQIAGHFVGHLDDVEVGQAIGELVDAGLWEPGERSGTWVYVGWLKHNEPVEKIEEARSTRKQRQREAAHRTNHELGRHDNRPVDGCPECGSVSPGHNGQDGNRVANRDGDRPVPIPRSANALERDIETDVLKPTPTARQESRAREPGSSGIANDNGHTASRAAPPADTPATPAQIHATAMLAAGIVDPDPPTGGELAAIGRAVARGHDPGDLAKLGLRAGEDHIREPRGWLRERWTALGNQDPASVASRHRPGPIDERRPPVPEFEPDDAEMDHEAAAVGLGSARANLMRPSP